MVGTVIGKQNKFNSIFSANPPDGIFANALEKLCNKQEIGKVTVEIEFVFYLRG
jgi:hypothetical protein